jgi:cellulose synthase/poly-beta-1,6-N-acetylglucosamine synthase-like glycosyltransferase
LKKDQHFWSPQLTVTVEDVEGETEIRGLYGPKPSVWTMFIFFYCVVGFLAIISTMVGLSNLSLEKHAGVLWLTPIFMLLFLTIYLVSNFGKKLGKDQLIILHNFFEKALNIKVNDHLIESD